MDVVPTGGGTVSRQESFGAEGILTADSTVAINKVEEQLFSLQAPLEETSVFPLPNQSNINSCFMLGQNECGCARILVACWSGHVHLLQQRTAPNDDSYKLMTIFEDIPLSHMPTDSVILAAAGFYRRNYAERALSPARGPNAGARRVPNVDQATGMTDACSLCIALYREHGPARALSTVASGRNVAENSATSAELNVSKRREVPQKESAFCNIYTSVRDTGTSASSHHHHQQQQQRQQRSTLRTRGMLTSSASSSASMSEDEMIKSMYDSGTSVPCSQFLPIQIEHVVVPHRDYQDRWLEMLQQQHHQQHARKFVQSHLVIPCEHAWIISGSDNCFHLILSSSSSYENYAGRANNNTAADQHDAVTTVNNEGPAAAQPDDDKQSLALLQQLFPELLQHYDSTIVKFAMHMHDRYRYFAVSVSSGMVIVSAVDIQSTASSSRRVVFRKVISMDSPVLVLNFFHWTGHSNNAADGVNVLVCPSLEAGVIYQSILPLLMTTEEGRDSSSITKTTPITTMSSRTVLLLPQSHFYDCPTTSCVADILLCGEKQVLIGTFGQAILIYTLPDKKPSSTKVIFADDYNNSGSGRCPEMTLTCLLKCAHPIHGLIAADTRGDGLLELACLSNKALHIYSLNEELLVKKLKMLRKLK